MLDKRERKDLARQYFPGGKGLPAQSTKRKLRPDLKAAHQTQTSNLIDITL